MHSNVQISIKHKILNTLRKILENLEQEIEIVILH